MNNTNITIVGNVATSPERHRLAGGDAVTRFRVASSSRRFDRESGRWQDGPTSWYSVSVFRGMGDNAFASLAKGDRVLLAGRLRIRAWEAGDKRGTDAEIEVDALGHDLLWGTTSFTPARSESGQSTDDWSASGAATRAPSSDSSSAPELDRSTLHAWAASGERQALPEPQEVPF